MEEILVALEKRPWQTLGCAGVFFGLWYFFSASVALFWATFLLVIVTGTGSRPLFILALLTLFVVPFLFLIDRPAQADRGGVLAFSLLALGIFINTWDTWRSYHAVNPEKHL